MKTGGHQTGFISLCREILTRFIEERFPTVTEGLVSDVTEYLYCIVFVFCGVYF